MFNLREALLNQAEHFPAGVAPRVKGRSGGRRTCQTSGQVGLPSHTRVQPNSCHDEGWPCSPSDGAPSWLWSAAALNNPFILASLPSQLNSPSSTAASEAAVAAAGLRIVLKLAGWVPELSYAIQDSFAFSQRREIGGKSSGSVVPLTCVCAILPGRSSARVTDPTATATPGGVTGIVLRTSASVQHKPRPDTTLPASRAAPSSPHNTEHSGPLRGRPWGGVTEVADGWPRPPLSWHSSP